MTRWAGFLRAINVGGRTVKMDRLRALLGEAGFTGVETFIASGNVIFDPPDHDPGQDPGMVERRIEGVLRTGLGYDVATFVRTFAELEAIAAHRSLQPGDPADLERPIHVGFLKTAPGEDASERLAGLATETDTFHLVGRELYWVLDTRLSQSAVTGAQLERALGGPSTLRNMNTVDRVLARYGGGYS